MSKTIVFLLCTFFSARLLQAQVIITGVMYDPVGADAGYEYIQFMATEDIDFSATPYAVVTCVNTGTLGPVSEAGWAAGGVRTFKFNLTKGKAAKGTFFYVGGHKKCIAGTWKGAKSTSISEKATDEANRANWIRTINYTGTADGTVVGDGFGEKTTGLIPNGSANPTGIAVFAGTDVTGKTVPIDAIFIASADPLPTGAILSSFNVAGGYGYLIPNNDHYTNEKGNKYFGQGENAFAFLYENAKDVGLSKDVANFLMLGGVYNASKKKWTKPRGTNYVKLCRDKEDAATATRPQLADIQTARKVTKLIP